MKAITQQLLATAACVATLATAPSVAAQDSQASSVGAEAAVADDPAGADNAIVVTGIRRSIADSVAIKRDAPNIVDAISAEDIGKFPDQNLAESLQRISGVQISREAGEGKNVSVRGLSPEFTLIQFNGRTVASSSRGTGAVGDRSFDFSILPSDFVSALEVYKTPMADLEEGALSATIQIRTPRPLDIGQESFVVNANVMRETNARTVTPDGTLLYSNTFADNTFGITLGAHYGRRVTERHGYDGFGVQEWRESSYGDTNLDGDATDTFRALHLDQPVGYPQERERMTGLATLQWNPSDNFEITAEAIGSKFKSSGTNPGFATRFGNSFGSVVGSTSVPDTTYGSDGILDFLSVEDVLVNADMRNFKMDSDLLITSLGGKYTNGGWTVELEGAYSEEKTKMDSLGFVAWAVEDASYDFRDGGFGALPVVNFTSGSGDPTFFITGINGNLRTPSIGKNTDFRLDVDRELNWGSTDGLGITSLEFGGKFSNKRKSSAWNNLDVSGAALETLLGDSIVADSILPGWGGINATDWSTRVKFRKFMNGFSGAPAAGFDHLMPDIRLLDRDDIIDAGTLSVADALTMKVKEKTWAGYAKLNFEGLGSRLKGNLGLRYVRTKQSSFGAIPDFTTITYNPATVQTDVDTTPAFYERTYDEFLPSFNASYEASDDIVIRFSAAKVMARPALEVLSPSTNINIQTMTVNSSNPNVDPFTAKQLDLSIEWYTGNGGMVAVAPFAKFIDSFVVTSNRTVDLTYLNTQTGVTHTIQATQTLPDNGKGSDMYGLELNWIQPLDFVVDGLGFIANATFVTASKIQFAEGGANLPLPGLSKKNYNLVGYYENDQFGVRLSYNYRDGFVETANTHFNNAIKVHSYNQLDLSATYDIMENISVVFEGINLTSSVLVKDNGIGIIRHVDDTGPRFTFGVRAKF